MTNHLGIPDEIFSTLPEQFKDPELDHSAPGPFGGTMGDALQQAIRNRIQEIADANTIPQPDPGDAPEGTEFIATGPNLQDQMNRTVEACAGAIQKVLDLHGCRMIAEPAISEDGRIMARIQIRIAVGGPPQPPR